jgi:hypothetical protein
MQITHLAFFQVKAIAFPISKSWFDKAFPTPPPGMPTGLLVRNKIAWAIMVLHPINQQVHWAEAVIHIPALVFV